MLNRYRIDFDTHYKCGHQKMAIRKANAQQKYCCNWGLTEVQSAAVHIQALYPADGILPVISS